MKTHDRNWRMHVYEGQPRNLSEIARLIGILPVTMHARLRAGKSIAEAIAMPRDARRRPEPASSPACSVWELGKGME